MYFRTSVYVSVLLFGCHGPAVAQAVDPQAHQGHQMAGSGGWTRMQDGLFLGLFNDQGSARGGREGVTPNWWMGMWNRERGRHTLGVNVMLSLDPATVGKDGYREIFQVGETLDDEPLIDRQHPHDLFMQLAGVWRLTVGERSSLTIAGGPAGEPTLGPVAFMHRPSASGLVLAPLGHHTFDSTHISFGVVTAGVEHGRWTFEGSVFNGREPDEDRWDFDFGPMDSVAGRVWVRPAPAWEVQASTGYLREPEAVEPGNAVRTTTALSWTQQDERGFRALTVAYGANAAHDEVRQGVFAEYSIERGPNAFSGRLEFQQVETAVLLGGHGEGDHHDEAPPALVTALSLSGVRRVLVVRGVEVGFGAQAVFHVTPDVLRDAYGAYPMSFQAFLRIRLPSGDHGRMWNMRMSQVHRTP
jgi:hypothetical protein